MTDFRADPDELLKALKSETSDKTRGRLKIFFGYAAGVGTVSYTHLDVYKRQA